MTEPASHVIAIDLGGTKALGAIAEPDGTVLVERTEPTTTEGPGALIGQLGNLAHGLARDAGIEWPGVRALAVGVPGTVDPVTGQIRGAHNIPDLGEISLAGELASLGDDLRVVVENDVNAAAIGERWQGSAKDADHFAFVAIGTGIGAGVVVDGELRRGALGAAGEIGFLPFGADPFDPRVRRYGALEEAVAGRGIVADVKRRLAAGVVSELGAGCTAADVFAAAARGDGLARESVDREARLVAMTIAVLVSVIAPELVVLGGGIGINELLIEPIRHYSRDLIVQPLRIEQSALGSRAGLVGALAMGLEAARAVVVPTGKPLQSSSRGGK